MRERLIKGFLISMFMGISAVLLYTLRTMTTERACQPLWPVYPDIVHQNIAIVTMTDSKARQQQNKEKANRWRGRDFDGILTLTRDNKVHYAEMHGYTYEDASWIVSDERPASWSKIVAVKRSLQNCDWVMWLDADTIITNSDVRLESLLPRSASGPDFVITVDSGGYNAGVWLLRRSEWSNAILDRWWSMKQFIRPPGDTKSGDNDALKVLLDEERAHGRHVGIAPQCSFNSYVWRSRIRDWLRLMYMPNTILLGLYRPGDFILHLAGIDDKRVYLEAALEEAENQFVQEQQGDVGEALAAGKKVHG